MTAKNVLADQIICNIGRELVKHGTAAANMKRLLLSGRQQPFGAYKTQTLTPKDLGLYRHDPNAPIPALQFGAPVKLTVGIKGFPARLTASASPVDASNSGALSHTILYDHWMGGTRVGAGSTVAASPSPAVGGCTVASGHGSRFAVGGVVFINGEPTVITSISTDAMTWSPDLPAAPAAGDLVLNSYNFFRSEAQTQSLTIETAFYESGTPETQERGRGIVGQCAWSADQGQLGTIAFDGMVTSHERGDLSLTVTETADDMGASARWDGQAYLFAAGTSTAPSHACLRSIKVTVPNKWAWVRCGSDENTINSAVATGGREDPITVEVSLRFDADLYDGFTAETLYRGIFYTKQGTGTAQRYIGWHFPTLKLTGEPQQSESEGLILVTASFVALQSTITSGSDIARSPAVLFAG